MRAEIQERVAKFTEIRNGAKGTEYWYVATKEGFIPVREFNEAKEELIRDRGRRKVYEVRIPLSDVEGNDLLQCSFANSGFSIFRRYRISGRRVEELELLESDIGNLEIKILGDEREHLEAYNHVVPKMVNDIKRIEQRMEFEFFFHKHAFKTEEVIKDPKLGLVTSMAIPTERGRSKSLENKIRSTHEIWILAESIGYLEGRVEDRLGERCIWLAHADEKPSFFLRSTHGDFTVWYQFPIRKQIEVISKLGEYLSVLYEKCAKGRYEEVQSELRLETMPTSYRECASAVANAGREIKGVQNVRPDIVIFKGIVEGARDIRDESRIRRNAVVIDPKIAVNGNDVKQLMNYVRFFHEGSKFILPCMKEVNSSYLRNLERSGWKVIDNVRPDTEGLFRFRDELIEAVREIRG